MKITRRGKIVAVVLAGLLSYGAGSAYAGALSEYSRFRKVDGSSKIVTVRIRTRCLDAEDSAAHLYLYRYGDGVAVYRCHHRGY